MSEFLKYYCYYSTFLMRINQHPEIQRDFVCSLKNELKVPDARGHRALAHFQVQIQNIVVSRGGH